MPRWEYLILEFDAIPEAPDTGRGRVPRWINGMEINDWQRQRTVPTLNRLGMDGWEAVATIPDTSPVHFGLLFKRPLPPPPDDDEEASAGKPSPR
jgi:hypothetical protein